MLDPRIRSLIARYLSNTITPAEKAELDAWIKASPDNRRFMEIYVSRKDALAAMKDLAAMDSRRIRRNFEKGVAEPELHTLVVKSKARVYAFWYGAVAAVLLLAVWGVWFFQKGREKKPETPAEVAVRLSETHSDLTKPVLIAGNESPVLLEDIPVNGSVNKEHLRVTRTGRQSISIASASGSRGIATMLWNTVISIPYGQSWRVSLTGLAKVDVAPGASLALIPSKDGSTELALDGEAFFDVDHNARRTFAVSTRDLRVDVLGTAFNMKVNDTICTATLVTGAVKVSKGSATQILKPGDEARTGGLKQEGIAVTEGVDTAERLNWRKPYFEFTDMNIRQVMYQVVRWYGLKAVKFDKRVDTVTVGLLGGGHVSKDIMLPALLQALGRGNRDLFFHLSYDKTLYISPVPYTSFASNGDRLKPAFSSLYFFNHIQ